MLFICDNRLFVFVCLNHAIGGRSSRNFLNELVAAKCDAIGDSTKLQATYFVKDHTHTNGAGARLRENRGKDGLFTAENWKPRASGLLGLVTLMPLREGTTNGKRP